MLGITIAQADARFDRDRHGKGPARSGALRKGGFKRIARGLSGAQPEASLGELGITHRDHCADTLPHDQGH